MPEITREEKIKLFIKLPPQLQEALFSDATADAIDKIGKKYSLDDEKISLLARMIGDIILGIIPITFLAQEINSKIISDAQAAMNLAQELNTELLAPVMTAPSALPTPAPAAVPPAPQPVAPTPRPVDEYREPTASVPEVVDLRKAPTPPTATPMLAKPPAPLKPIIPPTPITPTPPAPKPLEPPKPAPTTPLIEAEPHKIPTLAEKPIIPSPRPQYIMRPSGAPPTDLPDNVLDLRKDKGEF